MRGACLSPRLLTSGLLSTMTRPRDVFERNAPGKPPKGRLLLCHAATDPRPVKVDILQIEQVLLNLLHNSIEAFGEAKTVNPVILIEASAAGPGFVEIRVKDNGPGFPSDLLSDSFLPFLSTKAEGTGIGLSLCKSIIEAHGGRLWVGRDAPGGIVHFTIPAVEISHDD
jgi:two-component system, LuxR family, sensor kinase FixL